MRVAARGDARLLVPSANEGAAGAPPAGLAGLLGRLPFASIGLGAGGGAAPLTEKRTGTAFPEELEYCAGQRGCPVVTGAGARTKKIAGIKSLDIYALALYVDPGAARGALRGKFGGASSAEALAKDQRLYDELMAADGVEKTLRIVITSKLVKRGNFLEALQERLEPPLRAAGELAALDDFTRLFDAAQFRKGLEINFKAAGSKLQTTIDGRPVGTISNKALARSLLDIYLGRDPASKGAKESFGVGLASMVLASA